MSHLRLVSICRACGGYCEICGICGRPQCQCPGDEVAHRCETRHEARIRRMDEAGHSRIVRLLRRVLFWRLLPVFSFMLGGCGDICGGAQYISGFCVHNPWDDLSQIRLQRIVSATEERINLMPGYGSFRFVDHAPTPIVFVEASSIAPAVGQYFFVDGVVVVAHKSQSRNDRTVVHELLHMALFEVEGATCLHALRGSCNDDWFSEHGVYGDVVEDLGI